jgi:hypothetical protein
MTRIRGSAPDEETPVNKLWCLSVYLSVCLMAGWCTASAWAQTAPSAPPASAASIATVSPPSDRENYLSDRVKFQFATSVTVVNMTTLGDQKSTTGACAPAFSTFKGIGKLKVGNQDHPAFIVGYVAPDRDDRCKQSGLSLVKVDDVVVVQQSLILATPPDRYGLTYGTLIVPYKMQLKGDRGTSGSASLGGYLGFRQDRSGITGLALQYVFFAGGASISVVQNVNGQQVSQDVTGFTYGVALLGTVKDTFQLGVVLGADRVNRNVRYVNNNKPWIAFSLGFDFSN